MIESRGGDRGLRKRYKAEERIQRREGNPEHNRERIQCRAEDTMQRRRYKILEVIQSREEDTE
jgi:hypothetical protein